MASVRQGASLSDVHAAPEHLDARDGLGKTALHLAVECGNVAAAERLLQWGADPLVRDGFGRCPLHAACGSRQRAIVEQLLRAAPGAAAVADSNGDTPLHVAARAGAGVDVLRALLNAGAPAAATNATGELALALAARDDERALLSNALLLAARPSASPAGGTIRADDSVVAVVAKPVATSGAKKQLKISIKRDIK